MWLRVDDPSEAKYSRSPGAGFSASMLGGASLEIIRDPNVELPILQLSNVGIIALRFRVCQGQRTPFDSPCSLRAFASRHDDLSNGLP